MPLRFLPLCIAFTLTFACSADRNRGPVSKRTTADVDIIGDASGRYELLFAGVPVGTTDVKRHRFGDGYRLRRDDRITVRRDGEPVESVTSLIVETDRDMRARRVRVRTTVGSVKRETTAVRDDGGWSIRDGSGTLSRRSGIGIAELVMLSPTDDSLAEPMLLAGASFAVLDIEKTRRADGSSYRLTLQSDIGQVAHEVAVASDGLPSHWSSDSGESARRTDGVAPELEAAELLDLAAMPVRGRRTDTLRVSGTTREPPPSAAGQTAGRTDDGWRVRFSRRAPRVPPDLAALVVGVDQRIVDDLSAPGLTGSEALRMGRGDCSGHASALAELARQSGYRAKLATGYRRRGRNWMRHRWTVVELDGAWVSLDPSFGEARPRPGRLLLLAIHEATADAMALADLVAFAGLSSAAAAFE